MTKGATEKLRKVNASEDCTLDFMQVFIPRTLNYKMNESKKNAELSKIEYAVYTPTKK